ncbi:hypothetical protein ACLOJK_003681 [Asimina triloba]
MHPRTESALEVEAAAPHGFQPRLHLCILLHCDRLRRRSVAHNGTGQSTYSRRISSGFVSDRIQISGSSIHASDRIQISGSSIHASDRISSTRCYLQPASSGAESRCTASHRSANGPVAAACCRSSRQLPPSCGSASQLSAGGIDASCDDACCSASRFAASAGVCSAIGVPALRGARGGSEEEEATAHSVAWSGSFEPARAVRRSARACSGRGSAFAFLQRRGSETEFRRQATRFQSPWGQWIAAVGFDELIETVQPLGEGRALGPTTLGDKN